MQTKKITFKFECLKPKDQVISKKELSTLKTGDIITTSVYIIPAILHRGIIVVDEKDGTINVWHNSPDNFNSFGGSSVKEKIDDYLKKRKLLAVKRTNATVDYIDRMVELTKLKKFNLLGFNCEHFTSLITRGYTSSTQLTFW